MKGITYNDYMEWLWNRPLEQLYLVTDIVDSMIDSPEISTQKGYIVWSDGTIPKTFEEFTEQLSFALDTWADDNTTVDDYGQRIYDEEGEKCKIVSGILWDYVNQVE